LLTRGVLPKISIWGVGALEKIQGCPPDHS
jgi:hypothetical protein